jgi:hypothetical protein
MCVVCGVDCEGWAYDEELLKVYAHYGVSLVLNHCAPLW